MRKSAITGIGFHVPIASRDQPGFGRIDGYLRRMDQNRSGIEERRWVQGDEAASDLAIPASIKAMEMAGVNPEDIDVVVVGTISGDYFFPGVSAQLQAGLGLRNIAAFDIKAACSAFVYSLSIADQFIRTGQYTTALVVGAEAQTKFINKSTEGRGYCCLIWGWCRCGNVLQASDGESGILSTHLHCQGKDLKNLWMEGPGSSGDNQINKVTIEQAKRFEPYMNGREVFKNAVVRFPEVIHEALEKNNLSMDDISLIIPHQANLRIIQSVAKRMGVEQDKFYANIQRYGNTTAASIPIALCEAVEEEKVKEGDTIILAAFGAGYTWASAAIRW